MLIQGITLLNVMEVEGELLHVLSTMGIENNVAMLVHVPCTRLENWQRLQELSNRASCNAQVGLDFDDIMTNR